MKVTDPDKTPNARCVNCGKRIHLISACRAPICDECRETTFLFPESVIEMRIEKILKKEEIPECYNDHLLLSAHPIVMTDIGTIRYKTNNAIRWCCDHIDLNEMCIAFNYGAFTEEEYMQFYRDIGYSLCGFEEIFGDAMDRLLGIVRDPETGKEISRKKTS